MSDTTAQGNPAKQKIPAVIPIPPPDRDREGKSEPVLIDAAAKKVHASWLIRTLTSRRFWFILSMVIIVVACIEVPHLYWLQAPELDLRIRIVDKTVPYQDFREHRGLYWLLKQNKFIDTGVDERDRWYEAEYDYIGFDPVDPPEQYRTTLLSMENLADRDVLLLADTYGVYHNNYEDPEELKEAREAEKAADGNVLTTEEEAFETLDEAAILEDEPEFEDNTRPGSPKIFGGLEEDEVAAIENFASQSKLIIGEFNCFASPTEGELRSRMENVFGVTWSGWAGRFIADFQDYDDVPIWLREKYEEDTGRSWNLTGSGYFLIHFDGEYVILRTNIDLEREQINLPHQGLEFIPNEDFAAGDVMQGVKPCTYSYWFDIVEPMEGTEVLAEFQFHLTSEGRRKLHEKGLPMRFAAVTLRQDVFTDYQPAEPVEEGAEAGTPETAGEDTAASMTEAEAARANSRRGLRETDNYYAYYLAGDMVDHSDAMGNPDTRLTLYINRSYYGRPVVGSQAYFFWHTYYPMISNILRKECYRLTRAPRNVFLFD